MIKGEGRVIKKLIYKKTDPPKAQDKGIKQQETKPDHP